MQNTMSNTENDHDYTSDSDKSDKHKVISDFNVISRRKNNQKRIIYQILVRSYYDSNGDGIGDLKGVISKLPYLKSLGVNVIWMTPINKSPWDDNGYDVSDHEAIEPAFGTISDLKELINKAKKFDIDIMFDCVLNHVSTQNETFIKAINGDKKAQKHFIFRSGKKNNEPPSKLDSVFGGSAWEYVPKINKYYLHIFAKSQADVNWENPATRKKMISHVLFWQKLGIKMFRYNSIDHISKSDLTKNCDDYDCTIYTNGQKVHKYLQEIKDACANKEDVVFHFGEITSKNIDELIKNGRNDFDGVFIAPQFCSDKINRSKWTHDINYFIKLKRDLDEILTKLLNANILPVISFENHDESRANSRFGDDKEFRKECSTMLLATQIMLPGIPCIYQGQEIGMTNDDFDELDMFEDVANIDFVNKLSEKGASKKDILNILNRFARDKARTAMQWDSSKNAGFSKFDENQTRNVTGLLQPPKVNKNYKEINVKNDLKSDFSIIRFMQELIKIRKNYKEITYGNYQMLLKEDTELFAFVRKYGEHEILTISNFSSDSVKVPLTVNNYKLLLSNHGDVKLRKNMALKPYQTLILYR